MMPRQLDACKFLMSIGSSWLGLASDAHTKQARQVGIRSVGQSLRSRCVCVVRVPCRVGQSLRSTCVCVVRVPCRLMIAKGSSAGGVHGERRRRARPCDRGRDSMFRVQA